MLRVLAILIVAAVVVAVAWFLAGLPGSVSVDANAYSFNASVPVVAVGLLIAFLILYLLVRLIAYVLATPERVRRWRFERRRHFGDIAVTRTLLALGAGESDSARREAAKARRMLGDSPQTLLLAAEAGRLSGREEEAAAAFRALAERKDAAFLGLRGLLRQAIARKDWAEAAAIAREAEAAHPGAAWLRSERGELAVRTGAWSEALALADAEAPKAAFATAASEAEPDKARALRLAKQAWEEDPTLAPAAIAYARRLREFGHSDRSRNVLRRTWAKAPNPEIVEAALAPFSARMDRMQEANRLAQENPGHPETELMLARQYLEAGDLAAARRHAEAAHEAGLNERRLWLLMADISDAEGDTEEARMRQRDALREAANAPPDPVWRCMNCGTVQHMWQAACPACGVPGRIAWSVSPPTTAAFPLRPETV